MPSSVMSLSMANSIYKIFLIIFFCFWASIDAATDTLKQGDMLNSSVPLVSGNEKFTLSFFRSPQGSMNVYLGVLLQNEPIWVANRDTPIPDDSGVLLIDETGSLLIKHNGGDSIKLFSGQSRTNLAAVLQDDGNFVLKGTNSDGTADSEPPLWQSFDLHTDSLLPGMKLGINDKTGQNWSLTSWLSYSTPSPGAFTLEWHPSNQELIVKRRGVDFWTSGTLICSAFENIEVFTATGNYIFRSYSDQDGKYLNYTVSPCYQVDGSIVTSLWLMSDGSLVDRLTSKYLFLSSLCDGNTTDFGCNRWEELSCRHGQKLERRAISNNDLQVTRVFDNRTNLSLSDCKDMCWKNCSCVGVQEEGPNPDGTGCTFLSGKEMKDRGNQTVLHPEEAFYIIIPAPSEKQSIWKWILISVAAAAALVLIFFLGIFLFIRWRRLRLEEKFLFELMSEAKELEIDGKKGVNLKVYSVSSIMDATDSFSSENKVGEGGFGPVYKGLLPDGQEIAIKRLSGRSRQGLVEFKNELIIVAKLQHTTLVRLLGFCIQGEEKILVYEYMPNKSLDSYIFAESDTNTNRIVGTRGYMAPEYARDGIFSTKSDIFSFGVLVLEIISGRRSNIIFDFDHPLNLVGYAWELWREGAVLELVHPTLRDSCFEETVLRCINVALLCVEHNPVDRPSMSAVTCMLGSDVVKLTMPKQPAFSTERIPVDQDKSKEIKTENCTINNLTISVLDPR